MKGYKGTKTGQIRATLNKLFEKREFRAIDIINKLKAKTPQDKAAIYNCLTQMSRLGEIIKQDDGSYIYNINKQEKLTAREKAWKILRARKIVTIDELEELTAITKSNAKKWLESLIKMGIVQKMATGKYQIIKDVVEFPQDKERAKKMQKYYKLKKKEVLNVLNEASKSLKSAKDNIIKWN